MPSNRSRETPEPAKGSASEPSGFRPARAPCSSCWSASSISSPPATHAQRSAAQARTRALICDLGDVWFIDLAGLRVLLDASARARLAGARLTVTNCPPIVADMLAALRLEDGLDLQAAPPVLASRSSGTGRDLL
jgi:ABC-type transporter Mla MlaB component